MKETLAILATISLIAASALSHAAGFKDVKRVFESGNWAVLRSTDPMTDATRCTGIYKENYGIQLTSDKLYIEVKGGIKGITLRFGEKPAKSMRLPQEMEEKLGAIIISHSDFAELLESNRLRVKALTLVRGIANEDLDLSGLKSAVENIRNGCPPQAITTSIRKEEAPSTLCSDELVSRMKAKGLKEDQIKEICDK